MYISRNDLAISAQSVAVGFKMIGLISTLIIHIITMGKLKLFTQFEYKTGWRSECHLTVEILIKGT